MGDAPGDDRGERTAKDVVDYLIVNRRELGASLIDGWAKVEKTHHLIHRGNLARIDEPCGQ